MDGFHEGGSGVLNVRWNSKDPMSTLAHEFVHYLWDVKGLSVERSLTEEAAIDKQAARDLEELRAAS